MYIYIFIYVCICMYIYIYVCIYMCVYRLQASAPETLRAEPPHPEVPNPVSPKGKIQGV